MKSATGHKAVPATPTIPTSPTTPITPETEISATELAAQQYLEFKRQRTLD
jgi:hypothetical protein